MYHYRTITFGVLFALALATSPLPAQYAPPPETYTITQTNSMFAKDVSAKIIRDGQHALIEQTVPPQQPGSPVLHTRTLFDLKAQKDWTLDLNQPDVPCGAATFSGNWGDPFESSKEMTADLEKQKPKETGVETLNGFKTKVYEFKDPSGKGTIKLWIDQKYGLMVKWVGITPDGKQNTVLEVKQFSSAKPPASLFAMPAACAKAEAAAAAAMPLEVKTAHNVTAVHLDDPPQYSGPCPAKMHFTGAITTDGPGKVWFKISAGVTGKEGEGEIEFSSAGTRRVSKDLVVATEPGAGGGSALLVAAMEDAKGRHVENPSTNANNNFSFDCGGAAAAPPSRPPHPAPATAPGNGRVTEMTLRGEPLHYTGACPGRITFTGSITTDGPARVPYVYHSSMKYPNGQYKSWPGGVLTFDAAGTKSITKEITFVGDGRNISAWMDVGTRSPNPNHSKVVPFTVNCGGN